MRKLKKQCMQMYSVFDNSKNDRVFHEAAWDALIFMQNKTGRRALCVIMR